MTQIEDEGFKETKDSRIVILERFAEVLRKAQKYLVDSGVCDNFRKMLVYWTSNPIRCSMFFLVTISFLLPFLLFIIFALVNAVIAITSFLVIEVIVLGTGSMVLFCVLFGILSIFFLLGCWLVVGYYIYNYVANSLGNFKLNGLGKNS